MNEVLEKLKSVGEQPIEFEVISCQDTTASMVRNEADTFVDLMYGFFFFPWLQSLINVYFHLDIPLCK